MSTSIDFFTLWKQPLCVGFDFSFLTSAPPQPSEPSFLDDKTHPPIPRSSSLCNTRSATPISPTPATSLLASRLGAGVARLLFSSLFFFSHFHSLSEAIHHLASSCLISPFPLLFPICYNHLLLCIYD